jgi:Protein of unknown function (DUF3108)
LSRLPRATSPALFLRPAAAIGAALGFVLCAAGPSLADPLSARADYLLSISGIDVARATIRLEDSGSTYAMKVEARVSGLAQFVASGTATIDSLGRSVAKGLDARSFDLKTDAGGDKAEATVQYQRGDVTAFVVDPPMTNDLNRVPIERKQLIDVNDPIAPFVLKGRRLDKSLCDRDLRIFTGVERFDIVMHFASMQTATSQRTGYQGPVVLCAMTYKPISGHYTTSEVTNYLAASKRNLIWYAPVGDTGTFVPYRVIIGTAIGDLSMVLTRLTTDVNAIASK